MIRLPPRSTLDRSSAASDVYKRQNAEQVDGFVVVNARPSWAPAAFGGRGELFVALENLSLIHISEPTRPY